jgi:hypothetical protein
VFFSPTSRSSWTAGWRILQGQVPYRDFAFHFTPLVFYLQAIFFKGLGFGWSGMVAAAAVLSVACALAVIRIFRLLVPQSSALALCAGLLTASLFQTVFGTLWFDQTGFCLCLVSLLCALESNGRRREPWLAASGLILMLAALAKQNAAAFFSPVVIGTVSILAVWPNDVIALPAVAFSGLVRGGECRRLRGLCRVGVPAFGPGSVLDTRGAAGGERGISEGRLLDRHPVQPADDVRSAGPEHDRGRCGPGRMRDRPGQRA